MAPPKIIFGTACFGMNPTEFDTADSVRALLETLQDLNIRHLDTGARYPPLSPGRSEELIGEAVAMKELSAGTGTGTASLLIDTKVYTDTRTDGSGDLTPAAIEKSFTGSLQRLQKPGGEGVGVLYAHRADPETPLELQIQGFNEQVAQGRCKAWGVSNTPPDVLEKILNLCDQNGWKKPSCYQGEYSLISRGMETKLLPILRAHGIAFNAFRGLACGFLTGNVIHGRTTGTRFGDDHPFGKPARKLFGAEDLTRAMQTFDAGVRARGLLPVEVAARWLFHHSVLSGDHEHGDGVVLGASRAAQIVEAAGFVGKGPLGGEVLELVEGLWEAVRGTRGEII